MEKTPAGWKDYDVEIGGVSPSTTYCETFADKVRDGGVDELEAYFLVRAKSGLNRGDVRAVASTTAAAHEARI